MADIATPTTARKTEDFTATQRTLVKNSLGISDFPYQPEKTYIVFDADAGDNDLHIGTGSSTSYSILQGDGTQPLDFTDTGGLKILTYTLAGRYLITIDGTFNGIEVSGSVGDKSKYIGIIGGTNYPAAIANSAFYGCASLKDISFPLATTLEDSAFYGCASLKDISFPLATTLGNSAFYDCVSLKYIYFPLATTLVGSAFEGCLSLEEVSLPSITYLVSEFNGCSNLRKISAPLATTIGSTSLGNLSNLICVEFLSVTTIAYQAFLNCTNLTDVLIPLATTIGNGCFFGCTNLKEISIPSVSTIENTAFEDCVNLEYVYAPSLTVIELRAFNNTPKLKDVIAGALSSIATTTFETCVLNSLKILYNASLVIGADAFLGVSVSDLYIIGATSGQAATEETKFTTAGITKLNGYRLLY